MNEPTENTRNPLNEGGEYLRKVLDTLTDPVYVVDAISGEILYTNKAGAEIVGYKKNEIIGKPFYFLHSAEDQKRVKKLFFDNPESDFSIPKISLLSKAGELIHVEGRINTFEIKGVELKQAHFRLLSSEKNEGTSASELAHIESLLKKSPGYYFRTKFEEGNETKIVDLDEGMLELDKASKEDIVGTRPSSFFKGGDKRQREKLISKLIKEGEVEGYELKLRRGGNIIYGSISAHLIRDENGNPNEILGLFFDHTEEKRKELLNDIFSAVAAKAHEEVIGLPELSKYVFREIKKVIPMTNFYVSILDERKQEIYFPYHIDEVKEKEGVFKRRKFNNGLTEFVINNPEGVLLDARDLNEKTKSNEISIIGLKPLSYIGVPLIHEGQVVGVIATQSFDSSNQFDEKHLEIFKFLSSQIALIFARKKWQESLVESEKHFRKLVEGAANLTFLLNERGEIMFISQSVARVFNCTENEIIGDEFIKNIDTEDVKNMDEILSKKEFEFSIHSKGEKHYYSASVQDMLDEDTIQSVVISANDITDRVEMSKVALSLSKYPGENPDPIFRVSEDYNIMFSNPKADEILKTLNIKETIEGSELHEKVKEAHSTNEKVRYEIEVNSVHYLLTIVPIEGEGYFNIYGQDITQIKHSKELLKHEMQARFKYENALNKVYEIVSASIGEKFFNRLAKGLSEVLVFNYVFIAEYDEGEDDLSTLIFDGNGKLHESVDFDESIFLPCREVIDRKEIINTRKGNKTRIQIKELLENFNSSAFIGIPLQDSEKKIIGIIACMSTGSDEEVQYSEDVLKVFALRAATELERLKNERALKDSESRNKAILNAIPDHLFTINHEQEIINIKQGSEKGVIESLEKHIGEKFTKGFKKGSDKVAIKAIETAFRLEVPQRFEFLYEFEGKERVFEGIVACINSNEAIVLTRDNTEKKNAELEIIKQREFLRLVIDSDPSLIYVKNTEGVFKLVNHSVVEILGKDKPEDVESENASDFIEIVGENLFCTSDEKVINDGLEVEIEEKVEMNGETRYFHSIKTPLKSGEGNPGLNENNILGICLDITETKKAKEKTVNAVVETQEFERNRFAKDLHDGLGQVLLAARMNLDSISEEAKALTEDKQISFFNSLRLLKNAIGETRNISHGLMSRTLDQYGLIEAIKEICNNIRNSGEMEVVFSHNGINEKYPDVIELGLYRIFQELMNNIIKHADASTIRVELKNMNDKALGLMVEDDGKGFDVEEVSESEGIGLKNIRTRVEFLGGEFKVCSHPGKGSTFCIKIPLN